MRHKSKSNLPPRLGRARFEPGYGNQLLFQRSRSDVRTPLASQYRMHCLDVGSAHVVIGGATDVRRPTNQPTTLLIQPRRGGVGLQYLW